MKMERKSEDELEEVQRPGGGRLIQSEFNKGAAYARDCILANIIGVQNSIMNEMESEQYKTLQALLITIEQNYGEMHAQFKG